MEGVSNGTLFGFLRDVYTWGLIYCVKNARLLPKHP